MEDKSIYVYYSTADRMGLGNSVAMSQWRVLYKCSTNPRKSIVGESLN